MRSKLVALVLAFSLTGSGCAGAVKLLGGTPSQVQVTEAAADAVDSAVKLGEIVDQLAVSAHKLRQSNVIPVETDDAVQNAEIAFAKAKTVAVAGISRASSVVQIAAAAAPLVAQATQIRTALASVRTDGLLGTASIVGAQLPDLLKRAKDLIGQLGGNK